MLKPQKQTLFDAQALKANGPLRLAIFLLVNPVEKLRSGYWNEWANKIAKNINCAFQRLCYMYEDIGTTDVQDPSFRKAR